MYTQQNYGNHLRMHPIYHYILSVLTVGLLIGSVVNATLAIRDGAGIFNAILMVGASLIFCGIYIIIRSYPLKVQDRAIRAEENLRHYVLTHKLLDSRLTIKQIVALRFASDTEFPELSQKAAEQKLPPSEIKKAIRNWRGDYNRI